MSGDLHQAREALLNIVCEAKRFELETDADCDEGRWTDLSQVHITMSPYLLAELVEALGFDFKGTTPHEAVDYLVNQATKESPR